MVDRQQLTLAKTLAKMDASRKVQSPAAAKGSSMPL